MFFTFFIQVVRRAAKIAPRWTGPHRIEQLKGDCDVTLKLASGRKLTAHVNRLKPYHQRNEPEVIQDETQVEMEDCNDDETDDVIDHPPPVPPRVAPPGPPVPPRPTDQTQVKNKFVLIQPQLFKPQAPPRRSPRLANVSALEKAPRLKILTGEGVQKVEVQKTLISQSEDKISWAAVITETRRMHPAQEGSQLDWSDYNRRQAIADANYLATGDPLHEPLGINEEIGRAHV